MMTPHFRFLTAENLQKLTPKCVSLSASATFGRHTAESYMRRQRLSFPTGKTVPRFYVGNFGASQFISASMMDAQYTTTSIVFSLIR